MQFSEYFSFICQQIAAVFKIGNSKELPPIPDHLSEHCKDFIRKCLQRDPSQRPTSAELLQHPFIQNGISLEKSVAPNPLEHLAAISCRPKPKVPPEYYSRFILQLRTVHLLRLKKNVFTFRLFDFFFCINCYRTVLLFFCIKKLNSNQDGGYPMVVGSWIRENDQRWREEHDPAY